jgi:predicted DNA-binding ribbon-helix-helix protein|tara:strand:- start:639 stop:878 length:240 start_codon:yes stop_codon:yes gene_type:complete
MASKASKRKSNQNSNSQKPKNQQLIQMLSFRIVPAYFKEIEKVADKKEMTVSKLIRSYIKDGMHRDKDFTADDKGFNIG